MKAIETENADEVKKDFHIDENDDNEYEEYKNLSTQILDEVWENHLSDI